MTDRKKNSIGIIDNNHDNDDNDYRLSADLTFTPEDLNAVSDYISSNLVELLKIPQVRAMLALLRLERIEEKQVKIFDDKQTGVKDFTIKHNREQLKSPNALLRPGLLINPLCSIYFVCKNAKNMHVLSVGPRNECEIFTLIAGGFQPKNIRALDLISYTKFIDVGDMHAMPYANNSFHAVLLGWVIPYSNNLKKVVSETLRVAKPGAFIGIGGEFDPSDRDKNTGEQIDRVWHRTETLISLFGNRVDQVIFQQDVHSEMVGQFHQVMVIFTLKGKLGL